MMETFRYEQGEYSIYNIEVKNNEILYINITSDHKEFDDSYEELEVNIYNSNYDYVILNGRKIKIDNNKLLTHMDILNCD